MHTIVKGTNSEMLLSSSFSWTLPVNLKVCNQVGQLITAENDTHVVFN